MKKFFLGCVGFAFLICVVLGGFAYYYLEILYPESEFEVGQKFARALLEGNVARARSFTTAAQWHRIDHWTTIHQSVSCPFPLDLESPGNMGVSGGGIWFIQHRCSPYGIYIYGMQFETNDEQLRIVDWERVCDQDDICESD